MSTTLERTATVTTPYSAEAVATVSDLGRLPALTLTSAVGVVLVTIANVAARQSLVWSELLFWLGLLTILLPIAWRLVGSEAGRTERLCLVAVLGVSLFLVHVVYAPLAASAFDEFLHVRTAQDILTTGRLGSGNPLLPVSPYYPGLENATVSLQEMSGVSIVQAGELILLSARLVFMLSLYLFFEQVGTSPRLAGIACLVYVANPRFLYFDSQFSYESLALPLAAMVMYLVARRERTKNSSVAMLGLILMIAGAVVITHHVTSLVLGIFLSAWAVVRIVRGRRVAQLGPGPVPIALVTLTMIVAWALLIAKPTIGYLAPSVRNAASEVVGLLSGGASRELFRSSSGDVAPIWERLVGTGAVVLLVLGILVGAVVVWRQYRHDRLAWVLLLAALAYPGTLVARFTAAGAEVSSRTPEFLFIGVGFTIAAAVVTPIRRLARLPGRPILVALAALIFIGAIIVGIPRWQRQPGPYLVAADARSIDGDSIAAASWTRRYLGANNRFISDRVNRLLMGTYGLQRAVTPYISYFDVSGFYEAATFGEAERRVVALQHVDLVIVDRRLTTDLPVVGFYFQRTELANRRETPLSSAGLDKFDTAKDVDRLFDNGSIQVFDVRSIPRLP